MPDKFSKNEIQNILDEHGLVAVPIEATEKMLNAGIQAGAGNMQQTESIYASMLLALEKKVDTETKGVGKLERKRKTLTNKFSITASWKQRNTINL
ncbi:MAG: hypothetical protein KAJ75_08385 [Alphaproteobacteria bacterium]|nr:hypothetical protein [Alphaproteobacteria bacterium]